MSDVLDKLIVLSLNRHWQPIGMRTVRQAFVDMTGGLSGRQHPKFAMDLEFAMGEDGLDFNHLISCRPVPWEDWITLPVRNHDLTISTTRGFLRVPTVLVCHNYDKVPSKNPKFSAQGVYERDGGRCQYTDQLLRSGEWNLDHVIPRNRGGRHGWENVVTCRRDINSLKGNRLNEEVGLRLLRRPKAPPSVPVTFTIRDIHHKHWTPFILARR